MTIFCCPGGNSLHQRKVPEGLAIKQQISEETCEQKKCLKVRAKPPEGPRGERLLGGKNKDLERFLENSEKARGT